MSGFGPDLKRRREDAALSQSKLADRAGFDHSYVSRLESGARRPTREAIGRLATALAATAPERDRMLAEAGFLPGDPLHVLVMVWRSDLQAVLPHVDQGVRFSIEAEHAFWRLEAATDARTPNDMIAIAIEKYEAQAGSSDDGESSPER